MPERALLGEIGHRLGCEPLAEVATMATPDTIPGIANLWPASSMARRRVAVLAGLDRARGRAADCLRRLSRDDRPELEKAWQSVAGREPSS